MKGIYIELAFWFAIGSTILSIATETLTGYPGELVSQDILVVLGIVSASLSAVTAALLKRASG
jgi:hypothetical protein